jgi:chromosome segregation ATPase
MADRAKVDSLEALEAFRSSVVLFTERAGKALDEVGDGVRRTRVWLQQEQHNHWLREKKRRERKLEQAEQELYSSRLSPLQDSGTEAQMMVRRARREIEEAEAKLRMIKKWSRDFDSTVEPLARRLETVRDLLMSKYPKASAHLANIIQTLATYTEIAPENPAPSNSSDQPPPSENS